MKQMTIEEDHAQLLNNYWELYNLFMSVMSRIDKLEIDTGSAIDFGDLTEDDKGCEMISGFCKDITKIVEEYDKPRRERNPLYED